MAAAAGGAPPAVPPPDEAEVALAVAKKYTFPIPADRVATLRDYEKAFLVSYNNAQPTGFTRKGEDLFVVDRKAVQLTYRTFFGMCMEDGKLHALCLLNRDDGSRCLNTTLLFDGTGSSCAGNVVKHLKQHRGCVLTEEHEKARRAQWEAAPKSKGKRARAADDAEADAPTDVLGHLGITIGEYREIMASGFVVGSLPFNMMCNLGFKVILQRLRLPVVPKSTLWDVAQRLHENLVEKKITEGLATLQEPRKIMIMGIQYSAVPELLLSMDSWSDSELRKYASLVATGGAERVATLSEDGVEKLVTVLRPYSVHLALKHVEVGVMDGDGDVAMVFGAAEQSQLIYDTYTAAGVKKTWAVAMDTTNTQPKTCEEPPLSTAGLLEADTSLLEPKYAHATFVYCLSHVLNLVGKDVADAVPVLSALLASLRALTTWFRASPKRFSLLDGVQKDAVADAMKLLGAKKLPLKPMRPVNHRFFDNFLVAVRLWVLWPAVQAFRTLITGDGAGLLEASDVTEFNKHYSAVRKEEVLFGGVVRLFDAIIKVSPVVGSQERYTLSLRIPVLLAILNDVAAVRVDVKYNHDADVLAACDALERAAWQRLATMALMATALKPAAVVVPANGTDEWRRRIAWDDVTNAAMALDPATASQLEKYQGSWEHALTFITRVVVTAIVKRENDAADAPAAGGAGGGGKAVAKRPAGCPHESIEAHIAAIKAEPRDPLTTADAHAKHIATSIRAAKKAWGLIKAAVQPGKEEDDDEDWESALWGIVHEQAVKEAAVWREKCAQEAFRQKVGGALDITDNVYRYGTWPSQKSELPVMNFGATVVLGGLAAALVNEEFHSAAGIVNSKLRASLTPKNLEYYALARVLEQRRITNVQPDGHLAGYVDLDSVLDQLDDSEEEDDVVEIAPPAPAAGGAGGGAGDE
jgi:hypothetical protein